MARSRIVSHVVWELTLLRCIPNWRVSFVTAWQVIERLYDSAINAGSQSDRDGGITVWIGRPTASGT